MEEVLNAMITGAPNDGTAFAQECALIDATCNLPGKFTEAYVGDVASQQFGQSQTTGRSI